MAESKRPTMYIVIPALNEEETILVTLRRIEGEIDLDYQVIVVNDHSTDRTEEVVRGFAVEHPNVQLVNNEGGRGFTNALRVGYDAAGEGVIVTMMADLCDDPQTLPLMYEKIVDGYDVVCGSRYMPGGGKEQEDSEVKGALSRFSKFFIFLVFR